jgi:hypothetical protein
MLFSFWLFLIEIRRCLRWIRLKRILRTLGSWFLLGIFRWPEQRVRSKGHTVERKSLEQSNHSRQDGLCSPCPSSIPSPRHSGQRTRMWKGSPVKEISTGSPNPIARSDQTGTFSEWRRRSILIKVNQLQKSLSNWPKCIETFSEIFENGGTMTQLEATPDIVSSTSNSGLTPQVQVFQTGLMSLLGASRHNKDANYHKVVMNVQLLVFALCWFGMVYSYFCFLPVLFLFIIQGQLSFPTEDDNFVDVLVRSDFILLSQLQTINAFLNVANQLTWEWPSTPLSWKNYDLQLPRWIWSGQSVNRFIWQRPSLPYWR